MNENKKQEPSRLLLQKFQTSELADELISREPVKCTVIPLGESGDLSFQGPVTVIAVRGNTLDYGNWVQE